MAFLNVEVLEERSLPTTVVFNGTLLVLADSKAVDTISVDAQADQIVVTHNKVSQAFASADITNLLLIGDNGRDVIQNNTSVNSVIIGNAGDDTLFGGTGQNTIIAGAGKDLVYALLGTNTIVSSDDKAVDRVFTNFNANVVSDLNDTVVRFFAPHRAPGSSFIGVENNVLYITPSNNGSIVTLDEGQKKGDVVVTFKLDNSNDFQIVTFKGVRAISYFGGTGNDIYVNNTKIQEAAYGSAGNDILVSGYSNVLLKGSSGNDILVGRGASNDLSGNSGIDLLFALNGQNKNVFRTDPTDLVLGSTLNDIFISP